MKLLLARCGICDYWHNPNVHAGHCPYCGAWTFRIAKKRVRYYSIIEHRAIEMVRGIPNSLRATVLNNLITR